MTEAWITVYLPVDFARIVLLVALILLGVMPTPFQRLARLVQHTFQPIPYVTITAICTPIAGRSPERRLVSGHTPMPDLALGPTGIPRWSSMD